MIEVFEDFAARQPGAGALTVTRTVPAAGAYDSHGRRLPPNSTSTLPIIALVYPTEGRDLKIMIDQRITTEARALLTATKLSSGETGLAPDTVAGTDLDGDGVAWTCFHWERFPSPDGDTFYRCLVARKSLQ